MIDMNCAGLDKGLLLKFFWLFSAFEGALLDAGYFQDRDQEVWVDWKRFEKECLPSLDKVTDVEFGLARQGLVKDPPRQRVIKTRRARRDRNGAMIPESKRLDWDDQTQSKHESDTVFAFRMVRSVRNNLFHGGKNSREVARNSELITRALVVLSYCISAHEEIRKRIPHAA